MKKNKLLAAGLGLFLTCCSVANAQDVTTATDVQDGTIAVSGCYNGVTLLPANVWTLVLFDDAGNPCTTRASQLTGTCNPDSTWNWTVDGHLVFTNAPGYYRVRVRVQVWAGGGGGACYGGTADPIYCDNPYYKLLKQDETYEYLTDYASPTCFRRVPQTWPRHSRCCNTCFRHILQSPAMRIIKGSGFSPCRKTVQRSASP